MKPSTFFFILGIGMLASAIVGVSHTPHVFSLPQEQAALDAYQAAEDTKTIIAAAGSFIALMATALRWFYKRPTVCSKHTDPTLRARANQLLREAGCDVFDPDAHVSRADFFDMAFRVQRQNALYSRLLVVMTLLTVALTFANIILFHTRINVSTLTTVDVQCDRAHKCFGIDWDAVRRDIEAHPERYRRSSGSNAT